VTQKPNAAHLWIEWESVYQLREYEVDPENIAAESVAAKIGVPPEQLFVDRTDGILCFAVSHEIETRSASECSTSGTPKSTTSLPRDCSLRASAVMGFKCPDNGILTNQLSLLPLVFAHMIRSLDMAIS